MAQHEYEKGKVKVVWLEKDPKNIYSKMFETEKEAETFAQTKTDDYLIFSLTSQKNMEEFSWTILPYGRHKLYHKLVTLFHASQGEETVLHKVKNLLS